MDINQILPSDAFIIDVLRIGAAILFVVLAYGYRVELLAIGRRLLFRYVEKPTPADAAEDAVSPQQDAVKENAENGKSPALAPAELDRMLRDAADERVARAIGRLVGLGIIPAGQRARALIEAGIEGRRYTRWKSAADEAQAAAHLEANAPSAEPPRVIKVHEGRPGLERELEMEPLP